MTIVDIAKESGYSVSTVSRVLNNKQDVSQKAKKRIMEVVESYNFVPNNNAKHLKQTSTQTILAIVKGNSNLLFANIIEQTQKIMEKTNYTLSVYYVDEYDNELDEAIMLNRERKPIGILFLGGDAHTKKTETESLEIPCVMVTNEGEGYGISNLSSVATDDAKAAEEIMDYLIKNGHTSIGVIGGDTALSQTALNRHKGYLKSLNKHGLTLLDDHFEKARFSFDSAYRAMTRLLDKGQNLTAVVTMSDVMAIGAIRAIRDAGLNVPEDISVVGFDGNLLADYYNPKITTIRQGFDEMANRSVEILFNMIDLKKPATHEIIPYTLIEGESVRKI